MLIFKRFIFNSLYLFVALLFIFLIYCWLTLPKFKDISQNSRDASVEVYSNNNSRIAVYGEKYSSYVNYEQLSPHLINAVIAVEDNRFYSHHG
ncbi:MAG: hypothetical protein CMJ10_00355, partial [Pelagibacterales bacterium]|nr:hypothetical protein [Pelagibacterales bacterium]